MAMLVSLTSFAAALGDGYEKVTNISTLAEGDKVVLYCDDSSIGVTGVNGTKDAAVAATGWVEYLVEAATGGVKLKDTSANKYVSLTTKNTFTYAASGSVCKVNATGVLGITLSGTDYFLYNNGGNYYRMYTDKTGNSSYKPFYVYKILAEGEVKAPIINGEVEFETSTTVSIEVSEGLKAYYTLDGTEPTTASTEYTAPFEVTETATVKAVAYDAVADQLSEVAVVDFKKLQVLTCADAVALCTETLSEDKYIIKGYVTSIESAYDASFNNVSFWLADTEDGGNVIQAYRAYPTTDTDKAVKVGDYVAIAGKLKLYNSTPEIENGTFTITEAPAPEPVMETVYFVNALSWTGTINAYAWDPVQNAGWPGVAATKEAEQIAGYDVYSYTAEAGTYKNIIFNGTGGQTADLVWTAGKYYVKDGWYTKEEAEAQLAKPVEYESVYFVDNQGWGKANIYTWSPEVGGWPGVPMTKEAEQLAGYDVYSYTVEKGTSFGGMLFNNANGVQTGDLKWTAGKYYVKDAWYTKEEAIEKLSAPVTPPVITYVLMGVKGDWTTGIAMTQNPDNANEYVLLGQEILEGDSVKVVTLTDGVATAWCGNVDEYSPVEYTNAEGNGNIVLVPGKYDFYFKVKEDLIYIGGEAYKETITWELNGGEFPAVVVPTNAELWEAFKPYYNTYYGLNRADQPIDKVSTFANAKMQEIMTDEASEYKWLGDYVLSVATAAGVTLSTDMASANESGWRWAVHAFFNAAEGQYGAAGINFTEAGKQEVWGAAYEAEYGVVLPTEPVDEDYTLPTPVKEGYTFVGWYDNAEGEGEAMTVLPAGWAGTLYAIWAGTPTGVENTIVAEQPVKIVRNGQILIIKNGVKYNVLGSVVE